MAKIPTSEDPKSERLALGQAIALIREEKGFTQQEAADAADPTMSAQYWGMHETGKVAGIEKRHVLQRLAKALGVTVEDIHLTRERLAEYPAQPEPRRSRLRVIAQGLSESTSRRYETETETFVIPLTEGQASLVFPANLSDVGFKELAAYLALFLRTRGENSLQTSI